MICHTRKFMPFGTLGRLLMVLCLVPSVPASPDHASAPVPAKEILTYGVEWRMVRAGMAKFNWTPMLSGWQGDVHVESAGIVTKLYRVYDDYRVQLDNNVCAANIFIKSEEGKRRRETRVTFDHTKNKASYLERDLIKNADQTRKEIDTPNCVHDIFGGLQKLRTLKLDPGQSVNLPISDGKKFAQVKIEAQEREEVKSPLGNFKCIRYEIHMFDNVLINRSARCFVWLSDDEHRIPVQIRVRMQFLIGTINLLLEKNEH